MSLKILSSSCKLTGDIDLKTQGRSFSSSASSSRFLLIPRAASSSFSPGSFVGSDS